MNVWMTILMDDMPFGVRAYTAPIVACRVIRDARRISFETS